MRKQLFIRILVATSLVCLGLAMAYPPGLSQEPNTSAAGLGYQAGLHGNYVTYAGPDIQPTYANLNQIVAASTDIVSGVARDNRTNLSPDGTFITTDYEVEIQSVVKGLLRSGEIIKVSLPGGLFAFDAPTGVRTYANLKTPWFRKMSNGRQYFLFLGGFGTNIPGVGNSTDPALMHYETTGGPQGVFEIAGGIVKTHSGRLNDPVWQYQNMQVGDFTIRVQLAKSSIVP